LLVTVAEENKAN